ncbi:hypothetical protein JB92DRAFT_2710305 [Gautieria morchelliformis]|nr:hypothetical protein JB92DRAFT_2710305 [Gautieria morchelliformis]
MTSETEQLSAVSTNSLKYPHTRAILTAIAASVKLPDSEGLDADQDGDDGQRISPALVSRVVTLLQEEKEDELKDHLKQAFSIPDTDESQLDQNVLELMHKHRDDVSGVPFLFLTPTKRPISRPSSRASTQSYRLAPNRPETPNSLPTSPLASTFRRPHTPLVSPFAAATTSSYMNAGALSQPQPQPQQVPSASSSPLSSPRLLNAKAVEFRPTPRPLSAGGYNTSSLVGIAPRTDTPSPDLWAHNPSRATSNLAIAAPLVPDAYTSAPRAMTPSSSLQRSSSIDEDYEDEFDPFSTKPRLTTPAFHPSVPSDPELQWSTSSNSNSSQSTSLETSSSAITGDEDNSISFPYDPTYLAGDLRFDKDSLMQPEGGQTAEEHAELLTDGMTPFDVLSSVFGQSVSPAELTEALEVNGYDFESAMAWLVDKVLPQSTPSYPPVTAPQPHPHVQMGGRVVVVPREAAFSMRGRGAAPPGGRNSPRYGTRPAQGAHRVCRYFLAGECMRADCRFSHDLERAMCRFWLRGNCAKQETCEFLHHLPKEVDVSTLTAAMGRTELQTSGIDSREASPVSTPPPEDFPTLGHQDPSDFGKGRKNTYQQRLYHDPGRTRFAAAVKAQVNPALLSASRFGRRPDIQRGQLRSGGTPVPRPSPRIKLRPPTLLPTLMTGESVNTLYMSYRQRALQLGAARNACLSRAADAWRRGDGGAAKRFSREGHDLNAKMRGEAADAAGRLVRERVRIAVEAVRQRDAGWSDEPRDRADRGKVVSDGLGVILGVASKDVGSENGGVRATSDERTEVLLDLHGLHANEAVEVLESFLVAFEKGGLFGLAFVIVGEEKHTGSQNPARGTSRARLAAGVRDWLHDWGYPWSERDGIICVDPLTHL